MRIKTIIKILLFLSVFILAGFGTTDIFAAGSTTVANADSLISALADGYTDITVSGEATLSTSSEITIPSGTTVTFASGGNYITIACSITNEGTMINNNTCLNLYASINNNGDFENAGKCYNSETLTNTGTINNTGTFSNTGTIANSGTITSSGTWTDSGTFTGNDVAVDNPVEVINSSGDITYYTTFNAAVAVINNTGYELRLLKDITIDGDVALPIVPFTLTGEQTDGDISTLTVNNGNFTPTAQVTLKNIKLAHTGSTGGNFNTYYQATVNSVTYYYKTDLTVGTGVTFSDIDIAGKSGTLNSSTGAAEGSTLNVKGTMNMGSNSISDIESVNISSGGTLKVATLQTKNLSFSNGGTLDITGTGGLAVNGTLNSSGSGSNILSLPTPSDHSGTVYSAMLSNTTITATNAIKIKATSGVSLTNKCKLIYLNNTTVGSNNFVSNDSKFSAVTRELDGNQYLTVINATSMDLTCADTPITYGAESFTLNAVVKDGSNAAMTSGTVTFYKGSSASGTSLGTVDLDTSGVATCAVNANDYAAVGDNCFYALYEDSSDSYSQSSGTAIVHMNAKTLTVSAVSISDKTYDGTTAATITAISLSGIVGTDNITASAVAIFNNADVAENKTIDLSNIQLNGVAADSYTIAETADDIATTAKITKATPSVQLSAAPSTGAVQGDTVSLTAVITGAESGADPSGTVTFYNGSSILDSIICSGGQSTYTWDNAAVGTYSFSAAYSGDANYNEITSAAMGYIISKQSQNDLTVSGTPSEIHYGDEPFTLSTSGGSGDGALHYAVNSGASVTVDAETGIVTIVGAGTSVITVTKEGTDNYEPASVEITVDVAEKSISISSVSINDKDYDGTTAAAIASISLSGIVGTDNITVSAVAAFNSDDVAENKTVNLSDIHLSGAGASNYTIAETAENIATSAKITKATPVVQLNTSPVAGSVLGDSVDLAASIIGAANGAEPSGTVTFYKGGDAWDTVDYAGGQAAYTWTNAELGTYSLSARYSGDENYNAVTSAAINFTVSKQGQAALTVSGVPSELHYGDASFVLSASGGTGDGALSFAVKSGTSVNVNAATGVVTIVGGGESTITVTKAGSDIYAPVSAEVTVTVIPNVPGIPTSVTAVAGNGQAVISFAAPSDNGGSTIDEYVVTSSPGGIEATGSSSPITVTGLTNGTTYTFVVKAVNGAGTGLNSSDSNAVAPYVSSSGSSNGTTATTTQQYKAAVTEDGSSSESVSVNVDTGAAKATVDIPSNQVDSLNNGGNAVITIPTIPNVSNYTVSIPVVDLSASEGTGTLKVQSEEGSITVFTNMLSGISGATGSKAEITIGEGDKSSLDETVKDVIGDRPIVQLTLKVDGKQIEWNNPDAPVTVSIPYTPTEAELANPESIIIWYIDGSGKAVSVPSGHYDSATGTVTFATTHFSDYAIGFNKIEFSDVSANKWYDKAVNFVAARGIAAGSGNGTYNPDENLTRGEFIVMLMRAYGIEPDDKPTDNFADAGSTYYTEYLAAAKRLGISDGIGGNLFAPNREITRQEMFALLYNALTDLNQMPEGSSGKLLTNFSDTNQISSWAKEAVAQLVESGTVDGANGKLSPVGTTTRAQMAQVMYNLLAK